MSTAPSSCCRRSTCAAAGSCGCGRATSRARPPTTTTRSRSRARFAAQGATWLHVVDLDGARAGEPRQLELAAAIVAETHGRARVEVGGGPADRRGRRRGARRRGGPGRRRHGRAARPGVRRRARRRATGRPDRRHRSTSATASRSARAGARARPASRRPRRSRARRRRRRHVRGHGDRARRPRSRARTSTLLRALVALEPRPDHRVRRRRVDRRRLAVQAAGCAGAIVGRALYEGRSTSAACSTRSTDRIRQVPRASAVDRQPGRRASPASDDCRSVPQECRARRERHRPRAAPDRVG